MKPNKLEIGDLVCHVSDPTSFGVITNIQIVQIGDNWRDCYVFWFNYDALHQWHPGANIKLFMK